MAYLKPEIRTCTISDGARTGRTGWIYQFSATAHDSTTLPAMPFTVANVSYLPLKDAVAPHVWRMAMDNPDKIVEVESESDAGSKTMLEEAVDTWNSHVKSCKEKASWMNVIGIHKDIQDRIKSSAALHLVRVATTEPDYLENMFADGNAEIARLASLLFDVRNAGQATYLGKLTADNFFWPNADINRKPTNAARYRRAILGDFTVVSESIYAP